MGARVWKIEFGEYNQSVSLNTGDVTMRIAESDKTEEVIFNDTEL